MARYHMNPATGNPNKCSAKEGNCPFKSDDGAEATHYDNPTAAREGYEQEQRDAREKAKKLREEEYERNWPTPSADRVAEFEKKGYYVDAKSKSIMRRGGKDGRNWEIAVRAGTVNATISMRDSFGSALSIRTQLPHQGETAKQQVEFGDFGTTLSVKDAKAHVKDMEDVLRQAPKFVEQTNTMLKDAKELYGEPEKASYDGMYTEVEAIPEFNGTRAGVVNRFTVDSKRNYISVQVENAGRLDTRSDSQPDVYTDGYGEIHTRLSLSSFGYMDRDGYQERAERLKDTIETAKAMEATVKALPKPKI